MIKYPDTEQFRHTVKKVVARAKYDGISLPALTFKGSVKLHGTNASVVIHSDGSYGIQTRNRVLKAAKHYANDGHFGFKGFVGDNIDTIKEHFYLQDEEKPITIYGEWCGEGIQKKIALSELSKMFVIFAVRIGDVGECEWVNHDVNPETIMNLVSLNEIGIYHTNQFKTWETVIDFNSPKMSQNLLVEITESVEKECPVAKYFGVSGLGEGVVWKCITPGYNSSEYWFKVKGEKHSATKVKTLAEVDVVKLKSIQDFVDSVVTDNRLLQGIDYLKEMDLEVDMNNTGKYLSWVFADIMKEESDTMEASGLVKKDVSRDIGTKAREWFFNYLDNEIGLQ